MEPCKKFTIHNQIEPTLKNGTPDFNKTTVTGVILTLQFYFNFYFEYDKNFELLLINQKIITLNMY